MSTDAMRPLGATADRSTARLGPSLHIIAREVVVYGSVKVNLRAKDRFEIKKDGSVNGDLTTARIMIEDGAYFKGSIEIDKSGEKESGGGSFSKTSTNTAAAGVGPKTI